MSHVDIDPWGPQRAGLSHSRPVMSPVWHQAINWINADLLWIGCTLTHLNETLFKTYTFCFSKCHLQNRGHFFQASNVFLVDWASGHLSCQSMGQVSVPVTIVVLNDISNGYVTQCAAGYGGYSNSRGIIWQQGEASIKQDIKCQTFLSRKCILKRRLQNADDF